MNALIIPVYKNEETIEELLSTIEFIKRNVNDDFVAVFVVDGSPDNSYEKLSTLLPKANFKSRLITHSRNFGSFEAIRTGMKMMEADRYAVMAADLQEPSELIIQIFSNLKNQSSDIIFGIRDSRKDPFFSKLFSSLFWRFYKNFIVREIPKGGVDIFGCNKRVRDYIISFNEAHSSLIAQLFWIGFKRQYINYERRARLKGKSAWTFKKKIDYLLDSIFSVTDLPIKFFIIIGTIGVFFSIFFAIIVLIFKVLGMINVSGYTAIILTLIFFGAINILGLGIVGVYAHRAYENSKNRPLAIIVEDKVYDKKDE